MDRFDRVPEVRRHDLPDIATLVVGRRVDVGVYRRDPQAGDISVSSQVLATEVTQEVMRRVGVEGDRSLEQMCILVAQAAIGKLVTGEGFEVNYGTFEAYDERVNVQLRSQEPTIRQAEVTRTQPGE